MDAIRPSAVAGLFYPRQGKALATQLERMLAEAARGAGAPEAALPAPKLLVVPHAGYVYSGAVAAHAYRLLTPARATIRKVVLLGPAHREAVRGLALPAAGAFETPLGEIPVDADAAAALRSLAQVCVSASAHALEHALEVQLPFLQAVLERFTLVPLVVGRATPAEVAEVIEQLWGGPETLIVISTDLSHFHSDADARRIDARAVAAMLALEPKLDHDQACGATPVNGALLTAARHRLRPRLLDQRNSGQVTGDRERVVGYCAIAFEERSDGDR